MPAARPEAVGLWSRRGQTELDPEVVSELAVDVSPERREPLRLRCAEVKLSEPVGGRRLVDDGSGPFNPFRASVEAAERLLAEGEPRCVRVPAVSE